MQSSSVIIKTGDSSRKCNKVSDGEQSKPLVDRLSALPDGILCHILSFLWTKESVATSILSRRWRFLWTYVPKLDFGSDISNSITSFSNIINRVMMLHKLQSIDSFQLSEDSEYDSSEYDLDTWINTAVDSNVRYIDLDFDHEISTTLPRCLFTCKTLVDLSLYCCRGIPSVSSSAIYLPNLKKLVLHSIDYEVEEALPHLLSGCPVLEKLTVIGIGELSGCLNISSTSIKRLKVNCLFDSFSFGDPHVMVIINAPALGRLKLESCSYGHISISSITTSLVEVSIQLNVLRLFAREYFYTRGQVLKFLNSVRSMKRLQLVGRVEEFFERAVKLEVLIIREGYKCLKNGMEPIENHCACLLYSLKTVIIHEFECTEQEFNAVGYILRNAQVLKRMEIYYQRNVISLKARFEALQKISLFHRGSRECELAFS